MAEKDKPFKLTTKHYVIVAVVIIIIILLVAFWSNIKSWFQNRTSDGNKNTPAAGAGSGGGGSSGPPDYNRLLKQGVTGDEVKILQGWLGVETDGIFGPITEGALVNKKGVKEITLNQYANLANSSPGGAGGDWENDDDDEQSWWEDILPWPWLWDDAFIPANPTAFQTSNNEINWQS